MISCDNSSKLYESEEFTVYSDKVVQGDNVAEVISPTKVKSNYKSKESETYARRLQFKFSLNKKDNELPSGKDHWIVIEDSQHQSPIFIFGEKSDDIPEEPSERLPVNHEYTFRLDMRTVLKQFDEKGYYEAYDGSKVAKSDFKNVFIAGGSEPLTWDFSNLDNNGLALKDDDGDGIYELKLILNPYDPADYKEKVWELTTDISSKPKYESNQPIVDALFNMSLEEAIMAIEPDSTLRTGAKWGGVWTRDVSYSILLAFAYHEPEIAKISLMRKVTPNERIIQDTGSGGAYPVSSDRTTWALAAWEIYKVTGDMEWLKSSYQIIRNTLNDDYQNLSTESGMYRGESSFLDWREQTYPKWMDNRDIYVSENLGTNVVHYQAHIILSKMARALGQNGDIYEKRAASIKEGINKQLWMRDKGYYAQYIYGRTFLGRSSRFEALGEALAVLFEVADETKAQSILSKSPVTAFGTTCIYPQIPGIPPYHNNGVWPFVQSYWNLAAAKAGNEAALNHGLASIYRAGGLFLTNYENFVADNGDFMGTEINSHRMLWSMAGNLAMVHRVFMGINFEEKGIRFSPVIPKAYGGDRSLENFKYREAVLNINIEGHGNQIKEFYLDGKKQDDPYFSGELIGEHEVLIKMGNNDFSNESVNLVKNQFSPANPVISMLQNHITWEDVNGAVAYNIYRNGSLVKNTDATKVETNDDEFVEYQVSAVDQFGIESFLSEPIQILNNSKFNIFQFEDFVRKSQRPYTNHSGSGFVETSLNSNANIRLRFSVKESGSYLLDFRYSNGTGPWNTDNNCAMRTLYINEEQVGTMVMPQRGKDEWSDWGYSNSYKVELSKGLNQFDLILEDWNTNMDGEINEAMLDYFRLIKLNPSL